MAPEIILKKEYYGCPADVWALGILMYRVTAGYFPFAGKNDKELHKKIVEVDYNYSSRASDELKALLNRIFLSDPSRRISTNDIMNSSWLNKQD